jgi:hypothetical protein
MKAFPCHAFDQYKLPDYLVLQDHGVTVDLVDHQSVGHARVRLRFPNQALRFVTLGAVVSVDIYLSLQFRSANLTRSHDSRRHRRRSGQLSLKPFLAS